MKWSNLGGAVGTLGTGLSGIGVVSAIGQFNGSGNISLVVQWCVLIGVILSCVGKALSALFPPEDLVVKAVLSEHAERISQLKNDVNNLTNP